HHFRNAIISNSPHYWVETASRSAGCSPSETEPYVFNFDRPRAACCLAQAVSRLVSMFSEKVVTKHMRLSSLSHFGRYAAGTMLQRRVGREGAGRENKPRRFALRGKAFP